MKRFIRSYTYTYNPNAKDESMREFTTSSNIQASGSKVNDKIVIYKDHKPSMCRYIIGRDTYVVPILDIGAPHNDYLIDGDGKKKKLVLTRNGYEARDIIKSDITPNIPPIVDGKATLFNANGNDISITLNEGEYLTKYNDVFYKTTFIGNTVYYLEKYYLVETFDGWNTFFISKNDHEMCVIDSFGEVRSMVQYDRVESDIPFLTYKIKSCTDPMIDDIVYDEYNEPVQINGVSTFSCHDDKYHMIRRYGYKAIMRNIYDWGYPEELTYVDRLSINKLSGVVRFIRQVFSDL